MWEECFTGRIGPWGATNRERHNMNKIPLTLRRYELRLTAEENGLIAQSASTSAFFLTARELQEEGSIRFS
ncbi:hypothetical protein VTN77DRAFT_2134 [Rasamsonia byssochlamydoides]|uniref:uncharacterized protein n=1 Tax=Rasamsonia byssochlamydoides TaxID=89139 RepID=UPI0037448030